MSGTPHINKENAPAMLKTFVEIANLKGAYLLREANLLNKAIDYVSPEVKAKPSFTENDTNPRATALRLLVQGAHKAQDKGCFQIKDSAVLYEVCELVTKELEEITGEGGRTSPAASEKRKTGNDDLDVDDEVNVRPITVTKKHPRLPRDDD
jgi:hypothetical protein